MTLDVAIPDTSLVDCSNLREKTAKTGQIARALAIFKVERVFLYKTGQLDASKKRDTDLLDKLLRYLDTPQYLRRRAFPKSPSLQFAGTLPPLRTSSHPLESSIADIPDGAVRWGIQVRPNLIDLGLEKLVEYHDTVSEREPTLFRIKGSSSQIEIKPIRRSDVDVYWGFEVNRSSSLLDLLKHSKKITRIGFSRNAPFFNKIESDLRLTISNTHSVLAIFGGPTHGILDIYNDAEKDDIKYNVDFWVNTIPDQGTETVRLEEAVLISLGLLNNSLGSLYTRPGYTR
jgi:predicted SPOUT superfamily RNA methylase MTH1